MSNNGRPIIARLARPDRRSGKGLQLSRDAVLSRAISTGKPGASCHNFRSLTEPKINHETAMVALNNRYVAREPTRRFALPGLV